MRLRPRHELIDLAIASICENGYVGEAQVEEIASRLKLPSSRVYGFLTQFGELPGKASRKVVRVCAGPACYLNGADDLYAALKDKAHAGTDVIRDPGLGSWHRSPAVRVEYPDGKAVLMEGSSAWQAFDALPGPENPGEDERGGTGDGAASAIQAMPGSRLSPWCEAMAAGSMPEGWNPGLFGWASEHRVEALRSIGEGGTPKNSAYGGLPRMLGAAAATQSPTLICDAVGEEVENNAGNTVTALNARAVAAGALLAGAICGAGEILLYVRWNEGATTAAMEDSLREFLPSSGMNASVHAGPAHIPSSFDIGRAGVMQGIMLWQAASKYGWDEVLYDDHPLFILPADIIYKLPWLISRDGSEVAPWAHNRMVKVGGCLAFPRLVEAPEDLAVTDIVSGLGLRPERGRSFKAFHCGRSAPGPVPFGVAMEGPREEGAEILLLDSSVCMVRWALYLARRAEKGCCGGCTPGRLAPKVAVETIRAVLEGDTRGSEWPGLASLLEKAAGLALCPALKRGIDPVLYCLANFGEEFVAHCDEGRCMAGACTTGSTVTG
ncbi:MAG: NAD(P)H-dependent oxidoreductase subunit E [Actinomycetota bacterium]|nr:NAD(P)H-dependent oxidoreductase subunit E [Actinomycetota bacterium]